ncbi:hypothetical protein [Providencia sp. Me31A]|uniref:hypothetical protein n=1 Tax=Providencia sp. Me31A TaxID=3392637 RepID=UPI003D2C4D21
MQSIRLMGNGYEPHVERFGTHLTYSLPVDSGFASFSFTFEICQNDLDILLSDDYRRAVLEVIAHTLLQCSTMKGNDCFTQGDFDCLITDILHSTSDFLQAFIEQVNRENNIVIDHYVKEVMSRCTKC